MKITTQFIDKAALVAEIEKMKNKAHPNSEWNHGYVASCEKIISFLDTFEVKDVDSTREIEKEIDFEKEVKSWIDENSHNGYCSASIHDTAEHFYELALNAIHKQKA